MRAISDITINGHNLVDILEDHRLWWQEPADKKTHPKANLSDADLSDANLIGANLSGANLSGAKNLLNPVKWLAENFERDDLGYIVYKAIGNTDYRPPKHWKVKAGSLLEEVPNPLPTSDCGCGVNFGTLAWVKDHYENAEIWRCRIRWVDLPGVVVPFTTDGKARCNCLELLERVK